MHADGVTQGMKFSSQVKNIAAQEPFADLQDRLVGLADITEKIALERKSIMVSPVANSSRLQVWWEGAKSQFEINVRSK